MSTNQDDIVLQISVSRDKDGNLVVTFDKKPPYLDELTRAIRAALVQMNSELLAQAAKVNVEYYKHGKLDSLTRPENLK